MQVIPVDELEIPTFKSHCGRAWIKDLNKLRRVSRRCIVVDLVDHQLIGAIDTAVGGMRAGMHAMRHGTIGQIWVSRSAKMR